MYKIISKHNYKRVMGLTSAEKHERYGYTSLETLATWNPKIYTPVLSGFACRKETQLAKVYQS